MFLRQSLFFMIEDGCILIWDYQNHEQYILEDNYFFELLSISRHGTCKDQNILNEFLDAQIVTETASQTDDWGWDILSKIFHVGTKDVYLHNPFVKVEELAQRYLDECANLEETAPSLFLDKPGKLINLPEPDLSQLEKQSFFSVLKNRKTCRNFYGDSISLDQLSLILYSGLGLIHGNEWNEFEDHHLKTIGFRKASPASGGLHAEEAYIMAYNVDGLEKGIYHYRPQDHKLSLLSLGDYEEKIIEANYNQYYSKGLACGLYLTCRLDKLWWKYKHSRSFKVALLDLGHASQTFLLSATALKLQTWITAAFQDTIVNQLLQVDGLKESTFLFLGVGHGSNQAIPNIMLQSP